MVKGDVGNGAVVAQGVDVVGVQHLPVVHLIECQQAACPYGVAVESQTMHPLTGAEPRRGFCVVEPAVGGVLRDTIETVGCP